MAYAALVSVSQTLEQILDFDPHLFACTTNEKVRCFQETVTYLIAFLDSCPPICTQTVDNLITKIRDAAYEAEYIFSYLLALQSLLQYESDCYDKFKMVSQSLDESMEEIESMKTEVNGERIQALAISSRQLLCVLKTLHKVIHSGPFFLPFTKEKVDSIASLIAVLKNGAPVDTQTIDYWRKDIRDSACEADDFFESFTEGHFHQMYESESYKKFEILHQCLDEMMEAIGSIEKRLKNFQLVEIWMLEQDFRTLASSLRELVSVLKTSKQVLVSEPYLFLLTKEIDKSFQEITASLVACHDNCPPISIRTVNNLVTQIIDSVYEAKDVFKSLVPTHFLQKHGYSSEILKLLPEGIDTVMDNIYLIEKEVKMIHHDGDEVHDQRVQSLASSLRPSLRGNNNNMVALDNDLKMKLMEQLVAWQSKIDVIPIVGMGGIGKTTLSRILYHSQLVKESFEIRGWVTISQTYNVSEIVLDILKDIGAPLDGKKDGYQLLYQTLRGRKYLIVLDDVWNTQAWDDTKWLFPDDNNGSRIILTTRHSKVAAYANSLGTYYEMKLLNEDLSWNLLCLEIFLQNNCPPELIETGKEIARQCQGLPLVISVIGGHLKKEKQTVEYWQYVSENVSSVLKTSKNSSLEILTLSYNYLPHHLKACFLYFGSFQEDNLIDVSRLVKLWVAEGFVKPSRSNSMEEVAEEYLRDIIERNLVFVYEYGSLERPTKCGIHDLFRDICIREAYKEKFLCILNRDVPLDPEEINSQRRLVLSPNIAEVVGSSSSNVLTETCLDSYSFICFGNHTSSTIKLASRLLNVLKIKTHSTKFPDEILELVNLKYLELDQDVLEIPFSICKLRNLQTLVVRSIYENSMPYEFWEMLQLRHLQIWGFRLPDIIDVKDKGTNTYFLRSLQTLSRIINFRCTQEVLTRIPNLKKLNVVYDRDDTGFSVQSLSNLAYFQELESLSCDFYYGLNGNILQNLTFPCSLKKLVLQGSEIPWEQMTIVGILPNLAVLKLKLGAMKGNSWKTNDGEFKQLKFLYIGYSDILVWETEKDHFPRLRHLILKFCRHLEELPWEIGEVPTLEVIELDGCSPEAESSAKEILGEDSEIELKILNSNAHSSPDSNVDCS